MYDKIIVYREVRRRMFFNFRGGIYPDERKSSTYKKHIEEMKAPKEVILPLIQHKGTICNPIVSVGEYVRLGQRIAEASASDSVPIHASVSGYVKAIEPKLTATGDSVMSVIIENDFKDEEAHEMVSRDSGERPDAETLADIVKDAGIVGLGGSARPLSAKILEAKDNISTLIINGAECEPYITSDNRMMVEYSEELYDGAMLIAKATGAKEAIIAVESDKEHAIAELRRVITRKTGIRLVVLHTKYPEGDERLLVSSVMGREIPTGGTSADVGALVVNVSTAVAVARAVREGKPLTTRVVTVSGSAVANPKNLLVRIGTPIEDVFDACGGFLEHPDKIVVGGPMMGASQFSLDVPVVKATNALLAFSYNEGKNDEKETVCIRCGKCVSVCPMRLMPLYIYREYKTVGASGCEQFYVSDCTECGCCSYICPARIPLTSTFKAIKRSLEKTKTEEESNSEN